MTITPQNNQTMKSINFQIINLACILSLLFLPPILTHAQPGFGDDVNDVPVDGGLSLLVAAGVGYGATKLKMNQKKKMNK